MEEETGCVLAELMASTEERKRETAACPVNPTDACSQFAAWGFQLSYEPCSPLPVQRVREGGCREGGKLMIKWCPVKPSGASTDPECEEVVEEVTTVSEHSGYGTFIETEVRAHPPPPLACLANLGRLDDGGDDDGGGRGDEPGGGGGGL